MSLIGAVGGAILGGGIAGAIIGELVTGDGKVHGGSDSDSSKPSDPPPFTGEGTEGDDKVHIRKASGFLGAGLYDVEINGQHRFVTKEQLEATVFNLKGGNDTLIVDANVDANITALGGSGNDYMEGGAGDDLFDGGSGDNRLRGGAGNDRLIAGGGNDYLDGGAGNDVLDGGLGDNRLFGGDGNDSLRADSGNDYLDGGAGHDALDGGSGSNRVIWARDDFVFEPSGQISELDRR
jgi:Ca2+-binding RTX toxin-like protein